jgi:homoserine kinase
VLLGGVVVSASTAAGVDAIRFDAPRELRAVLYIPDLRLSTRDMRAALPAAVPLVDAAANLAAVAVGVAGLATGHHELLGRLTVDRLHEPYRTAVYPQLPGMVAAAREAGALGACLSGAGSTIIAFTDSANGAAALESALTAAAAGLGLPGRARTVALRNEGARVVARA